MKYKCKICGYIYDDEKEGVPFENLPDEWKCPICGAPKNLFVKIEEEKEINSSVPFVNEINEMAKSGKMKINAMSTDINIVNWDDILLIGNSFNPLEHNDEINTKTVIGKNAKKPLEIDIPVYISHMSFGALSKEAKIALSKGSNKIKTAICSGEGGILQEEKDNSYKYIFEYVPNKYSVNRENLRNSDAIEIKIGQGTKPGMGGHLPADKVTDKIAEVRSKKVGEDIISPSKFSEINNKEDLKNLVSKLREESLGRPIGVKIAAGHIEEDLDFITYAMPDFITIDGRGGATGASPKAIKDNSSIPTIYALYRARKYLDEHKLDIDLVITGGLKFSGDFAKALAIGADAIAVATAPLVALGCEQYRVCHSGKCPKGIATQDEKLRKNLNIESSSERVYNYFKVVKEELSHFARITSHKNIHELNINDVVTTNSEISNNTNIKHC